ncbi:hypothetical protein [Flavivirga algicola]|uniref:Uncharacterized protein n=1 Tax=Flavivirga algicola TaxID=2729136 RepID=A0ABX1S325_9FLAO|nr:hypothetical protein [Flavivirga algicola]NMH89139.1 hypothetical protein [Flavivirga algicola]
MDIVTIVIIGVYTLIYLIVFIIQYSQIKKQKDIIDSMKTFIDIFKVDEVKKYASMREERIKGDLKNMINNDEKAQEIIEEVSKNTLGEVHEFYKEKTGEKVGELFNFCVLSLKQFSEEERKLVLDNHFVKSAGTLKKALAELEGNNNAP